MASPLIPILSLPPQPNPPPPPFHNFNHVFSSQHHPLFTAINQSTTILHLKQVHAQMLRTGLFFHSYSSSKLFTASALSSFSTLHYARQLFHHLPHPNLYSWNTLIRAYASSPHPLSTFSLFLQMLSHSPHSPNNFTFPFLLKAASALKSFFIGRALHGMAIKSSLASDLFILNSLIHFYGSCGDFRTAYQVFAKIPQKDVVSWNSIITTLAQSSFADEALRLFKKMEEEKVEPNDVTMVGVLSACTKKLDLEFGRWICAYIERNDITVDLTLRNAMLDMYTKCGSIQDARKLFDQMHDKDIVSWTTMLDGYSKLGDYDAAKAMFKAIPFQDIATWNVLISSYEQNGEPKKALSVFNELLLSKNVAPDEVTLVSTLSACAQLGAIDSGGWIHAYIRRLGIDLNCHLMTSLIDMYAKCGDLEKAVEVFYSTEKKDVFVWSAMIGGYGMHGQGKAAIDVFFEMQRAKVKPNAVTFTNLLCACSHAGLVNEGRTFFFQMEPIYGVVPTEKHYSCVVDVLGRAGFLDEAMGIISKMSIAPTASVWGALLGGCKLHMNVELAETACSQLLGLEPRNHGAIVLLSNIYAKTGKWDEVSELRKRMRDTELKKEPGCSSIEVNGVVHEFVVGDNAHPGCREIYLKLEEMWGRLKGMGYSANTSQVLQLVEEEELKELALNLHSEKLAIAFGLIGCAPSQPIRVVKNLRVCGDCHEVAKLVSSAYGREIVVRDRYRFHHFRNGECSCKGYW